MERADYKANSIEKFTINDIMQGIPGGFFIYRAGGDEEIIYANDAMLRLFRCDTMDQFRAHTGNSFKGIVHPDDLDRVESYIGNQIEDDFHQALDYVEYRIIRRDGSICWVEDFGHLVHDETEGDIFYVFISDITERIKRLNRERVIHQEMIDAASSRERQYMDMIQALSRDYTNVYRANLTRDTVLAFRMSSAITKNFGNRFQEGSYGDLIRFYVETAVYEPDKEMLLAYALPEHLMQALEKETSSAMNYRVMRDGEIQYFRMSVSRIESTGEDMEVAIGFSNVDAELRHEMEQRKLVEYALDQAQHANSAKTTFLSNMSHDMRTPMNAIMGFSAIAASHIDDRERVKDCLEKISSSSAHLLSLINDILDMSRIESGKLQIQETECSLSELLHTLENIIHPQVKSKHLDLTVDAGGVTNDNVWADTLKLNQVFINILGNAVKFTPAGGAVSFRVRQKPCAVPGCGTYEFSVKDTGIGMSQEFIQHIFEPFERESTTVRSGIEGTGLGMAITKNIVDMMGGTIQVHSEKGKGSEFVICLDLRLQENGRAANPKESQSQTSLDDIDFTGKRVLLVEDNELNREIATEILREAGFIVEEAVDGSEAVRMVERSEEYYYDVILTDIQMPVMDGYEEVVAIRSLKRGDIVSMPIIAMTANAFEEDKALALKCGMNGHIAKPLDIRAVFTTLQEHLK